MGDSCVPLSDQTARTLGDQSGWAGFETRIYLLRQVSQTPFQIQPTGLRKDSKWWRASAWS